MIFTDWKNTKYSMLIDYYNYSNILAHTWFLKSYLKQSLNRLFVGAWEDRPAGPLTPVITLPSSSEGVQIFNPF